MRVFISWSGDLSKQLGEAIRNWLPSVLQYVKPYFSPADIEMGARWATEVSAELSKSAICIIILTRDNLDSKWIMFEAGAISKVVDKARVCPIAFGIELTDIQGPLAQFQATRFTEDDFRQLVLTVNSVAGEQRLSDSTTEKVFTKWWPDLEIQLKATLDGAKLSKKSTKDLRTERDILEEALLLIRGLASAQRDLAKNVTWIQRVLSNIRRGATAIDDIALREIFANINHLEDISPMEIAEKWRQMTHMYGTVNRVIDEHTPSKRKLSKTDPSERGPSEKESRKDDD
jgi:hypothetical protein